MVKSTTHTLEYAGHTFHFVLIENRRLKNLSIQIHPEKGVVIKNPGFTLDKVLELVRHKAPWILRATSRLHARRLIATTFVNEGKVLYLGEAIVLGLEQTPEQFYKEKTPLHVKPLVEKWAFLMGVQPKSIAFRKTKRRWGSCSSKAELSFTLSLAQLPLECIEYIVIHELCHITHPHHQQSFWHCVHSHMPHFTQCEGIIRGYSPALS